MQKTLYFLLFLFHAFVCVKGQVIFQNRANPFVILITSLILSFGFISIFKQEGDKTNDTALKTNPLWFLLIGGLGVVSVYGVARDKFLEYIPSKWSDVLPQLEAQAKWYANGEFPYQTLTLETHSPFPVYMPIH